MDRRRLTLFVAAALLFLSAGAAATSVKGAEASATAHAARPAPAQTSGQHVDDYGNVRWRDEKARLDSFAFEVKSHPATVGYILCYGGRVGREGEARRRCERAKNYLVNSHRIDPPRVLTIDGGFRERLSVELWPVREGASPPAPVPTVVREDVTFTKAVRRLRGARRAAARGAKVWR